LGRDRRARPAAPRARLRQLQGRGRDLLLQSRLLRSRHASRLRRPRRPKRYDARAHDHARRRVL